MYMKKEDIIKEEIEAYDLLVNTAWGDLSDDIRAQILAMRDSSGEIHTKSGRRYMDISVGGLKVKGTYDHENGTFSIDPDEIIIPSRDRDAVIMSAFENEYTERDVKFIASVSRALQQRSRSRELFRSVKSTYDCSGLPEALPGDIVELGVIWDGRSEIPAVRVANECDYSLLYSTGDEYMCSCIIDEEVLPVYFEYRFVFMRNVSKEEYGDIDIGKELVKITGTELQ